MADGLLSPDDMMLLYDEPKMSASDAGILATQMGSMMLPGASIPDVLGYAYGLPSLAENIYQGNLVDAALQGAGLLGDMMYAAGPITAGLTVAPAAALKSMRAARPSIIGKTGLTPARKQLILKEVEATRQFDPSASSFFHGLKNREDMTKMPVYTADLGLLSENPTVRLEDFYKEYLVPAYGDRSAGGSKLLGYEDIMFNEPVPLQAGKDYARNPGNAIWNTDRHKNRYAERARRAKEEGTEANLIYTTMAGDSGDFNKMTTGAWLQSLDLSKISKVDAERLDDRLRAFKVTGKKNPNNPDWPGIFSDELPTYLMNLSNSKSANLFKELSKGMYEKAGLPQMDKIRRAQTSEDLLYVPTYRSGAMIGRMTPDAEISDLVPHHNTYTREGNVLGEHRGALEVSVPDILIFREPTERFMDEAGNFLFRPSDGKPFDRANLKYTIDSQAPMALVDDQMLEDVDFYYRSLLGRQ